MIIVIAFLTFLFLASCGEEPTELAPDDLPKIEMDLTHKAIQKGCITPTDLEKGLEVSYFFFQSQSGSWIRAELHLKDSAEIIGIGDDKAMARRNLLKNLSECKLWVSTVNAIQVGNETIGRDK